MHPADWLIFNWEVGILAIALTVSALLVWRAPGWQVDRVRRGTTLKPEARFQLENEARRTWIQIVGWVGFVVAAYSAIQSIRLGQETHRLAEQGQITERFSKAIEHLGDPDRLPVRLGGIYALERIARDSAADSPTVVEVLCAFVRSQPASSPIRADIQAVLDVIARREREAVSRAQLHLEGAELPGYRFAWNGHFEGVVLTGANLQGANLSEAFLTDSANLDRVHLEDAVLEGTRLTRAKLRGAFFSRETRLIRADLRGTDLTGAKGLTTGQILGACTDAQTILPSELRGVAGNECQFGAGD